MKNIIILAVLMVFSSSLFGQNEQLVQYEFEVQGNCGMCKERIEQAAIKKGKAKFATWDVGTKILTVTFDENKTDYMTIKRELALAGHDNGDFLATDDHYNDLHGCCKYRGEDSEEAEAAIPAPSPTGEHEGGLEGYVFGLEDQTPVPLIGATIQVVGSELAVTSDETGFFSFPDFHEHDVEVEIRYLGYEPLRVKINPHQIAEITLSEGVNLEAVTVTYRKRTTEISFIDPINAETITQEELCKAACCNLSESFETNPAVDISYSDAVTGTRQIQMLGLAGPYVQVTRELIPDIRAMSSTYGMSMTPGPWIESIQLIKGIGSVVSGHESITGQINVELKKPNRGDRLFINGYVNNGGRTELNTINAIDVTKNISTALLLHGKRMTAVHDNNDDGFTDMPREEDFVVVNRWVFEPAGKILGQFGVKVTGLNHEGGYHDHFAGISEDHENHWQMYNRTRRYEAWGKIGYVNPDNPNTSVGLQLSGVKQEQDGTFGLGRYDSDQQSLFANLLLQQIFNSKHTVRAGFSYQLDEIEELVKFVGSFDRSESTPGVFTEYTYSSANGKMSIIPGIRADFHNNYGTILSPRLHAKYNFSKTGIFRLVAGRGFRTANIFAENIGMFSTSRTIDLQNADNGNPYGLEPEVAWNYGFNITYGFPLSAREMVVSLDMYRTDFENQVILDWDTPTKLAIYNLDGKSYANSFQLKAEYELAPNFDIRAAYRWFDVQTDYMNGLRQKPLVAEHRAFINLAYKTPSEWYFDLTTNWNGAKRLPYTGSNPEAYRRENYSPDFFLLNGQIMKRWGDRWDVYLGGENLLNFKQKNAIIASDDAFGNYFDASMIWAPVFGTNVYLGFRYKIGR